MDLCWITAGRRVMTTAGRTVMINAGRRVMATAVRTAMTTVISVVGRWWLENLEFKVILSLGPAWDLLDLV